MQLYREDPAFAPPSNTRAISSAEKAIALRESRPTASAQPLAHNMPGAAHCRPDRCSAAPFRRSPRAGGCACACRVKVRARMPTRRSWPTCVARARILASLAASQAHIRTLIPERRHALTDEGASSRAGSAARTRIILTRRARRLDGREDAAASARDLLVCRALAAASPIRPARSRRQRRNACDPVESSPGVTGRPPMSVVSAADRSLYLGEFVLRPRRRRIRPFLERGWAAFYRPKPRHPPDRRCRSRALLKRSCRRPALHIDQRFPPKRTSWVLFR